MKPNYKNWIPKGMLYALIAGTAVSLAGFLLFGVFGMGAKGGLRIALSVVFAIVFFVCGKSTQWCVCAYNAFPMTENVSSPNRLSTVQQSILHFRNAEWG